MGSSLTLAYQFMSELNWVVGPPAGAGGCGWGGTPGHGSQQQSVLYTEQRVGENTKFVLSGSTVVSCKTHLFKHSSMGKTA